MLLACQTTCNLNVKVLAQQVAPPAPDHKTALFSRQLYRNDTNKGFVSVLLLLQVSALYLPQ